MPCSCAASSASAICRAIASASSTGSGPLRDPIGKRRAFDQLQDQRMDLATVLEPVDAADIRMIQRGQHVRLAREARPPIGIVHERVGQNLQRDIALQLRVVRAIHLAHAAFADQPRDAIRTDRRARLEPRRVAQCGGGRDVERLIDQDGRVLARDQRLDFAAQCGIITARLRQPRSTRLRRLLERRLIDVRDLLPAFRGHGANHPIASDAVSQPA